MTRFFTLAACLLGLSAVALGAAGAHATASASAAALAEKAAFYQLIHAVALLALPGEGRLWMLARMGWLLGILLFSGSLFVKAFALAEQAPLAPAGGMLLMLGWLLAAAGAMKQA